MNPFESNPMPFAKAQEQTFIQKVYQWMAAGLALTGFVAFAASNNMDLMRALATGPAFWILFLAQIGLVFWLTASVTKISPMAATAGFLIYSALNGLTMAFIFLVYTGASIASTFFICAGTFATVSFFGWTTKSDLTSLRGFFMMALIGFMLGSIVNIFFQNPAFYWVLTYAGIALFIGLTAYDTQKLKHLHQSGIGTTDQVAILGALILYLDFINLFLLLLRLFGRRRD